VRAYCTQPVSEMARISTPKASESCALGNIARPTPSISSATRMDGKRQHHVAHAHDEGVDPAADEARQQAQAHADHHRQQHRRQAHEERDARAVHQRRQDVAALVVGAQQVGGLPPSSQAGGSRASTGSAWPGRRGCAARSRARTRADDADRSDDGRQHGHRRAAKAVPDVAVQPARQRAGGVVGDVRRSSVPAPGASMRRRGSTAKYSRSTTRLMTTKISAIRHR
jgi:hypothetical protein